MEYNEIQFWNPQTERSFTLEALKTADIEIQKDVMRYWFFSNYEDPAQHTPHESNEGGYIYIWGGPYDAREELADVFDGYISEEVIEDLVEELESECSVWTGTLSGDDYEDNYFSAILSNTEFHQTFIKSIENITTLLAIKIDGQATQSLYKLLYSNVITALETYLSDAFINTVMTNHTLIRKFVESTPDFKKQKFDLSEIFEKFYSLNAEVKSYLLAQVWHNLSKVMPMYKDTLEINFPENLEYVFKAINTRHDIVHRNGKSKSGEEIIITIVNVRDLIDQVCRLVKHIDDQFHTGEEH